MNLLAFYSQILQYIQVLILIFSNMHLLLLLNENQVLIQFLLKVHLLCLSLLMLLHQFHHDLIFLHLLLCEYVLFLFFSFLYLFRFLYIHVRIVVCQIVIFDMLLASLDKNNFFYRFYCFLIFHNLLLALLLLHILLLFHLILVVFLALPYILDILACLVLLRILLDNYRIFLCLLIVRRGLLSPLLLHSFLLPLLCTSFKCWFIFFAEVCCLFKCICSFYYCFFTKFISYNLHTNW